MSSSDSLAQVAGTSLGWRRLRDRVARLTRRNDAEDLLHDAWVGLRERSVAVRNPEALLTRASANLAIDRWRRESRIAAMQAANGDPDGLSDGTPGPDDVMIARQRLSRLQAGIGALPPRTRQIFLMHRLDGLKYREIALDLGISQSAVEKHIAKAMTQLMQWMEDW